MEQFGGADLSKADLTMADLTNADLGGTTLSHTNLSFAKLSNASLTQAELVSTNLSSTDLSSAYIIEAILLDVKLSNTNFAVSTLLRAIIIACEGYRDNLKCQGADFTDALLDDKGLENYLHENNAKGIPFALNDKRELKEKLVKRGRLEEKNIENILKYSYLPD